MHDVMLCVEIGQAAQSGFGDLAQDINPDRPKDPGDSVESTRI